jgi:hypothetical protein
MYFAIYQRQDLTLIYEETYVIRDVVTVIVNQELTCLILAAFVHEESRRFRDENGTNENDTREDGLNRAR